MGDWKKYLVKRLNIKDKTKELWTLRLQYWPVMVSALKYLP